MNNNNPYLMENGALRSIADHNATLTMKSVVKPEPPRKEGVQEVCTKVKIKPSSKVKTRQRSKKRNFIIQHEDLPVLAAQLGITETAVVNAGIALVKKYFSI